MYKRYQGNSGRVRRVEDAPPGPMPGKMPPPPGMPPPPPPPPPPRAPGLGGLFERLGGLLPGRLLPGRKEAWETEDWLLLLILYLLYRESGDPELLIALGAMALLE